MLRNFLFIIFFLVTPAAQAAQTLSLPPLDISQDVLPRLRELLPNYTFTDTGTVLHVRAPNGAETDLRVLRVRFGCGAAEVCGQLYAKRYAKILGPVDPQTLRLRLTVAENNLNDGANENLRPWLGQAFGPFLRECGKGEDGNAPPLTRWDAESQGVSLETLVAQCEQATRQALAPLDGKSLAKNTSGLLSNSISSLFSTKGVFYEPNASVRLLFPEQWAGLAQEFGGALLVVAMERDGVAFVKGNDQKAADIAKQWAESEVDTTRRSLRRAVFPLCMDAWLWTPSGWTLMTPHLAADHVLAAVNADFPERKAKIVDSGSVSFVVPGRSPATVQLQYFDNLCRDDPKECLVKLTTWMHDHLYPLLRGDRKSMLSP